MNLAQTMNIEGTLQGVRHIPSWDELCIFNATNFQSPEIRKQIVNLKNSPPKHLIPLARLAILLNGKDAAWHKFLTVDWQDAVDLLHDVLLRNLIDQPSQSGDNEPAFRANRAHAQQPCTVETATRRVHKIAELCNDDDPILVLGDDDLIGLRLAEEGFTQVTSVDIDPHICHELTRQAETRDLPLTTIHHDIRIDVPESWKKPYRLVVIDPMYSISGLRMFLDGALNFLDDDGLHDTQFFVNVHLLSLLRPGLDHLPSILRDYRLELEEYIPAFNRYPIPSRLDAVLSLFNRRCLRTDIMLSNGGHLGFLQSDALFFRRY